MYPLITYLLYIIVSIAFTIWVASALSRNGRYFLVDSFQGNERLADSVNQLLVIGFYLINIGYICLALSEANKPDTAVAALELLSTKIGKVLLVLGAMHFFNLYVFSRVRKRAATPTAPRPLATPPPTARSLATSTTSVAGQ